MKRTCAILPCLLLAILGTVSAGADQIEEIRAEKYELPNGLDVILYEDHRLPVVAVNVWYHVGSKNERPGRTGFAHLFEHMMFQGSEHHDTDYFLPLQKVGSFVNGSTSEDRTNYVEDVPSEYLELALWLEADRMGFLLPAMTQERLDNQRDVVMNERRETYDNQPYGTAEELLLEMMYTSDHPYYHSVIGKMHDIEIATLDDVQSFFTDFYSPNNASLCLVGDFDRREAKALIEKYFATLPPGPSVDRLEAWIPQLDGVKRAVSEDAVSLPRLYMQWHTPAFLTEGDATADILASILSAGKTSRLYEELVYKQQIAQDVAVYQGSRELSSLFCLQVTAKPGHTLAEVEAAVDEVLSELLAKGIKRGELAQAQAAWEARFMRNLERIGGFGGLANKLNTYNTHLGDPNMLVYDLDRYRNLTVKRVNAFAREYLDLNRRAILHVVPYGDPVASEVSVDRTIAPGPGRSSDFRPPVIERATLENGMKIWLVEKHDLPLVQVNLVLKSGWAADPPDRPGTAALTADLLDEGTKSRSALEIAEEARRLGANFGTFGAFDATGANLNVLKRNLRDGLDLMADVIMNPNFPEKELERLRGDYLGRIQQSARQPIPAGIKAFQKAVFGDEHPYGQPFTGTGTAASLQALTRQDVLDYYAANYFPNNTAICVAGDVTMEEIKAELTRAFRKWKPGELHAAATPTPPTLTGTQIQIVDRPGSPQSAIIAGHRCVARKNRDWLPLQVMNTTLGGNFISRVNMNLREDKGYTYGANTQFFPGLDTGAFFGATQVETAVTAETVRELVKEIREITDTRPPSNEEVRVSKDNLIKSFPRQFQTLGALAGQMGQMVTYDLPPDDWQSYMERIARIDEHDAARVARQHLHPDDLLIVVVGDRAQIEPELEALGLGSVETLDIAEL